MVKFTTQFRKDYKLAIKRGLKIELLEQIVALLAAGQSLPEKNKDHALTGNWVGHRECHILPAWFLVYRVEDDVLVLTLTLVICLESNRYEKAVVALSLRRLFEYLTPYATTATSPASHQTTFEKYELAYQYMRFWRTFLYQHVCRCTHNVEHDSDIFYDVSVCYRQWYWRCGAFYGFLITRPAQRNESIHYVPQDRSKTARKKERACGRFRSSEPPTSPCYSNKKATSFSADGFGPSGESRTHGLLNPIQARYQTALHPVNRAVSNQLDYYN